MASEAVNPPVNGVHIPQQSYAGSDHPALSHTQNSTPSVTNGAGGVQNPGSSGENAPAGAADSSGGVSKDEVGWYFVEQYYTTLSRNPEKLHVSDMLRPNTLIADYFFPALSLQALPICLGC